MAILEDIEVRVARNTTGKAMSDKIGEALPEYEKPNRSPFSGQAFQIEVYIRPSFKLYRAKAITVNVNIDGGTVDFQSIFYADAVNEVQKDGEPIIISSVTQKQGTKYSEVAFTFESLALDERLDLDEADADNLAETQGRLVVSVDRVRLEKLRSPEPMDLKDFYKPQAATNVGEDVYKKRHIRHSFKPGMEDEVDKPPPVLYDWIPYVNSKVKELEFVFRYRDHLALELLGCIPKQVALPSPVAEPTPAEASQGAAASADANVRGSESTDETLAQSLAELKRLQAFEQENKELKQAIDALKKENAELKAFQGQVGALLGNSGRMPPTPSPSEASVKPEVKKDHVKEEPGAQRAGSTSGLHGRPAKRPREYVELD